MQSYGKVIRHAEAGMGTRSVSGRELRTRVLGALPVVNHLLAWLGLDEILARHLPHDDARCKLRPAIVVGLLVRNLVLHRQPAYVLPSRSQPPTTPGPQAPQSINQDLHTIWRVMHIAHEKRGKWGRRASPR